MLKTWISKIITFIIMFLFIGTSIISAESINLFDIQTQSIVQDNNTQSGDSFTIIALPDTQNYASTYPEIFINQTQWIVANKEILNIVYVGHEGDIVNNAKSTNQWIRADISLSYLEDPIATFLTDGIPYSVVRGNHDLGKLFEEYFGVARFNGRSYYGGHYSDNNQNNYVLFNVGDLQYISISLDYNPDIDELNWTKIILETYSDRKAIIISHSMLDNPTGDWTTPGLNIYNTVKEHPNVFLMLCGHKHYEGRRKDTYNGNIIYTLLADYQDYPNGGNGWLRILKISPSLEIIKVKTYSPYLNQYKTDPESEFILYYNESEIQPSPIITGPIKGKTGVALNFNFTAIDPEDDQIYYFIDWGDDENTGWIGPYNSGEQISKSHTWLTMNNFTVRAKAMDTYYHESNWSTININIPKIYIYKPIIIQIFKMFEQISFIKGKFIRKIC
jgi:hypothetical protein